METRRIVVLGLFVAIAGVLHIVESWVALPIPVPGAKLGLANIVALMVIHSFGWRDAFMVTVLRVLLGSLLGGALIGPAFAMSMGGGLASTAIMAWAHRKWQPAFSLVGISVLGAATHNIVQISIAAFLVSSGGLYWYLPYLLLFALPTGVATGLTSNYFLAKFPKSSYQE